MMDNNETASLVIVAYKPKPGKAKALKQLVLNHVPDLDQLGLVTTRKPVIVEAHDGTIIEIFEWKSAEAIAAAHTMPEIHRMWEAFAEACDYTPLHTLAECADLFTTFKPLN